MIVCYDNLKIEEKPIRMPLVINLQCIDWNMIAAIGSIISVIVALITLNIAYKQLMQPLNTKISYGSYLSFQEQTEQSLFHIRIFNKGFKTIFIENIGYYIDDTFYPFNKKASINIIGEKSNIAFPYVLVKDVFIDVSIDYSLFQRIINSILKQCNKNHNSKICFGYKDCFGKRHKSKAISVREFYKEFNKIYFY